jgi:hypothetical protein
MLYLPMLYLPASDRPDRITGPVWAMFAGHPAHRIEQRAYFDARRKFRNRFSRNSRKYHKNT